MKVRIDIDTRTFVRFWLVVIGFALVALIVYSARVGLVIIGTALFLALALNGPVSRLSRHLPGKSRFFSTAISYLAVVVFLAAFFFLAVPPIVQQTAKFAQTVPDLVESSTQRWQGFDQAITHYHLRPQFDQALSSIRDNASNVASNAGNYLVSGVGSFFSFITSLLLVLFLSFFMLLEGPEWMRKVWGLYEDEKQMEHHRKTVTRMANVVSGYVTGQLSVSALDGFFAGVAVFIMSFFVAGMPSNLAVAAAAIMFIFSLIPMFGAVVGAVLVCLLLGFTSWGAALIYAIYFVIYQQLENNLIAPAIQSKRLELSPLIVLAAVTVGVYVFGVAGAIISIPIAGMLKVLLEEYLQHAREERKKSEKPLHRFVKKTKQA